MREFKFKAWFTDLGKMFNVSSLLFAWERPIVRAGNHEGCYDKFNELSMQNVILLQYTGFRDTNGKEIYEGDILDVRHEIYEYLQGQFKVVFRDGAWWVDPIAGELLECETSHELYGIVFDYDSNPERCCKVVGNIYENPDLIE